jgi:hypothetical protein
MPTFYKPRTAGKEGNKFWKRFKMKLKRLLCNDPKIRELLEQKGALD